MYQLYSLSRKSEWDCDAGSWEQGVERCPECSKKQKQEKKKPIPFNIPPNVFSKNNSVFRNCLPTFNKGQMKQPKLKTLQQ